MKYLIFCLIMALSTPLYADIYVVTDKDTKEVVSVSNENDCVVRSNMELTLISDTSLSDIVLASHPTMYKYVNGQFKANMPKLQDKEAKELEAYNKKQEVDLIEKQMKRMAIQALKANGIKFKYKHVDEED